MKRLFFFCVVAAVCCTGVQAQSYREQFDAFEQKAQQTYADFTIRVLQNYAEFVKQAWESFEASMPVPMPQDDPLPPIPYEEEQEQKQEDQPLNQENEQQQEQQQEQKQENQQPPIDDRPIVIEEVIEIPQPKPAPQPAPQPQPTVVPKNIVQFELYGTKMQVRIPDEPLRLANTNQNTVAAAIEWLTKGNYTAFIEDCQTLSQMHHLTDFFYLRVVDAAVNAHLKGQSNEKQLLKAFILSQSGYKTRLALDENKRLLMLFGTDNIIYSRPYWTIDNTYYYADGDTDGRLQICNFAFPEEQSFSLVINREPRLALAPTEERTLSVEGDKRLSVSVAEDKNLIQLLETYPSSQFGANPVSRWALYANMPLSSQARNALYPQLQAIIEGLPVAEQLNLLLRWVQKSLVYEYDDKVWGHDRAFFADETLYYPYADCEDRSILFSRLVRDLIGLRVALVYYPGHLATAVEAPASVKGDYLTIDNSRFLVCDPTYIGAPIGRTMKGMDNLTAKVIVLD